MVSWHCQEAISATNPRPSTFHWGIQRVYVRDGTLTVTAIVVRLCDTVQEPSETAWPQRGQFDPSSDQSGVLPATRQVRKYRGIGGV